MPFTLAALPVPVRAALWYAAAVGSWGAAAGTIRYAAADLPALEIGFLRALLGMLMTVPWLLRARAMPIPRRHIGMYLLRGGLEVVGIAAWFTALAVMLAADVVALNFTTPLFATLLGVLFLGERVRLRRSIAIGVGLVGAVLVIKPGFGGGLGWVAALPIVTSVTAAMSRILARRLAQTEPVLTIVASLGFITAPALLPFAVAQWRPVTAGALLVVAVIAVLSLLGHVFIVRALRLAEASALAPYEFVQLLVAVAFGVAVLGEIPDIWTWVGSAVILAASVYIVRREAQLAKLAARAAPSPNPVAPPPG